MDENNLDSLLDELSSMDGELNENIDIDSGVDVDADDMDDISLDELDHLDGMDLGDLDFDDIDFDDVDITKLDAGANPVVKKKPQEQETDDMSLDALIEKANQENVKPEPSQEEPSAQADNTDVFGEADLQMQEDTALPEGVFDDALFGSMDMGMSEEPELSEKEKNPYTADEDGLDALLQSSMAESLLNGDLADIEDIGEKTEEPVKKVKQPRKKAEKKKKAEIEEEETEHKKKTISEILFGVFRQLLAADPQQYELRQDHVRIFCHAAASYNGIRIKTFVDKFQYPIRAGFHSTVKMVQARLPERL